MQGSESKTLEDVRQYYSSVLSSNKDLQTNACCTAETPPEHLRGLIAEIHPDILDKFYGCGSPVPTAIAGCTVLDLGCGTGRDCFILSKLVGERGSVIGIDMTEEQISIAREHTEFHREKFGYAKSNVEFKNGFIEDLASCGIADNSVDVVISNCVINLSPNKQRVFEEIFRVLKPGGELYFSDVFATARVPEALQSDPVLRGECLGGALYIEDFRRLVADVGCPDHRIVSSAQIVLGNEDIKNKVGHIEFCSLTIRAFKLPLEDRCEDFGQVAYYKGTIPDCATRFALDDHHVFVKGKPMLVCGNTADMLTGTRLAPHFDVVGDKSTHYGLFDCSADVIPNVEKSESVGGCC